MSERKTRLIAYLRVSSDGQARDDRFGLPNQRSAIKAWAQRNGCRIVRYLADEGVSGTEPAAAREGLSEALAYVGEGRADGVIVAEMGRFARLLIEQEAILAVIWNAGGRAYTADEGEILEDDPDDPMRRALRQMRGIFHQLDRDMIVKRLRDGRRTKREEEGRCEGPPPYGYRAEAGALVEDEFEQAGLRRLRELDRGGMSTRRIAERLAEEGHPTKRGGRWTSPVVSRILSRYKAEAAS